MRAPVIKAMCFVLANGTLMISAFALAQGLGSGHVSNNAEGLGMIAIVFGLVGLATEALGILPRVHAWIAGAASARRDTAEHAKRVGQSGTTAS